MNIEDLRIFVEVADSGGVAPGGRRLGLSKSIVSRRLTRLEEKLGAQLLSRTTRGTALTEAGQNFREHAVHVIAEIEAAQDAVLPEGEIRGLLRIAAPTSFGITRLAPVFAELAHRHPLLHLDTSYSDGVVDLVGDGLDCAVRLGSLQDSSLIARRICSFRGQLVASPAYLSVHGEPRKLEDLEHHQIVTRKNEAWPLKRHGKGKTITVRPRGRFTTDNGEAVLAAALSGVGLAGLPDFLIDQHLESGALVPVLTEYSGPEHGMFVVRLPSAFPSRKIRKLIDILIEYFGDTTSSSHS